MVHYFIEPLSTVMTFTYNKPIFTCVNQFTRNLMMKGSTVGRVFANGPGDLGSIPGHVLPKTLKIVLDTYFLDT